LSKTALITGIAGQDGSYLAQLLLEKGYQVYGIHKDRSALSLWRLQHLNILEKCHLLNLDITDSCSVFEAVKQCQPDEIYHLAAIAVANTAIERPIDFGEVNGMAVTHILEAVRNLNPRIKLFCASSIQMLGCTLNSPQSPDSYHFEPRTPYAIAKLYGFWMARIYRDGYGLYVCNGILSNHESPLRSVDFVTRKITNEAAKLSLGVGHKLVLGNLEAKRDWGYAPDFVRAMWAMLQPAVPHDYVLATGLRHTLKDFLDSAFSSVNLNWQDYVIQDDSLLRRHDDYFNTESCLEIQNELDWQPSIPFEKMVNLMVNEDLTRWKKHLKGEKFPWDLL
jgi:GDPmannose 4,6-dehydratase